MLLKYLKPFITLWTDENNIKLVFCNDLVKKSSQAKTKAKI